MNRRAIKSTLDPFSPIMTENEANVEAGTTSPQEERPGGLTLQALRGIVPAIPGRISSDFEDQIEEAMEEEATRIVAGIRGE
jgi:hypothetical protein